ncbi:1c547de4-8c83-499d-b255-46caf92c351c [Sclerotinia trifoliorum]|uniref:1c547de4-8c83-499d-b255-46caf92c351c n=1 Tax=Sclerotinia trifoliorum TaxID=28548 RepID=A0A8H2W2Y1_9HELO|nr:1c547de4-8c83-499d-b255-46caf92c351c [Sclerotinia trifoliorum]
MGLSAIMHTALGGAKDLIPSRLRRSRHSRRSKGSRYISKEGIISRYRSSPAGDSVFDKDSSDESIFYRASSSEDSSEEEAIICYAPSEGDFSVETNSLNSLSKEDGIVYKIPSVEDFPEEETVSHSPSSKEKTVFYKAPSAEDFPEEDIVSHGLFADEEAVLYEVSSVEQIANPLISENSAETVTDGPCEAEENKIPQVQASVQELVAHFETLKEGSSEIPVSEVSIESLMHNPSRGKSSTNHINGHDGHDDSKSSTDTIIHKPSEASEVHKISRRQDYKNKIRRCLSSKSLSSKSLFSTRETSAPLNKLEEESSTHHIIDQDDSKGSTDTIIHIPLEVSEVPKISRRQEYKTKIRRCLSSKSLSSTQQFIAPSKTLEVESSTNNVYQKKKFSTSNYSISIYSQEGIDEIFVSPEEKELNALKAKLFHQELELKKLRSENSQLRSDPTSNSVSESETVVHTPLENTRTSNRERCRSKVRQYVSSTHELMAPLKALHPSNRAERGHAKRLYKERLEALENAPMFFETVPFESTDEAEAPIFYCPRHVSCSCEPHPSCPLEKKKMEEQALPITEHSSEVFSADDYILHIKDLSDEFLGIKPSAVEEKLEQQIPQVPEQRQPKKSSIKDHTGHVNHLADDRLGVTGFNPRTGVLDSSEEHKTPRRVHWASTENGWESRPIRSPTSSTGGRKVPRRFGKKKRAADSEATKEPECTKVSEPVKEPKCAEAPEPAKEPECAEVLEPVTNAWGDFLAERKHLGLTVHDKFNNKCITTSTITIGPLGPLGGMVRAAFGSLDEVDD